MNDIGTTLQEIDAGANACSVEWCPVAGLESCVACSTYLLADSKSSNADAATASAAVGDAAGKEMTGDDAVGQTRTGSIVVHKVSALPVVRYLVHGAVSSYSCRSSGYGSSYGRARLLCVRIAIVPSAPRWYFVFLAPRLHGTS